MAAPEIPVHTNLLPRIVPFAGLRVREDTAFTDQSGSKKSGTCKRTERDLQEASEVLSRLVQPDETVLYVSRGAFMPNNWEQLLENHETTAARALLVFTNSRLIVLRIKSRGMKGWKWDQGILTVEWSNLVQAVKKGWLIGYLLLQDQTGRRERYFRMPRRDLKKVGLLLRILVPQGTERPVAAVPGTSGFVSLCPKCLAALSPNLYQCAQCGLVFKNETSLLRRALLVPGGAYFYTGQSFLGIVMGFIEGLLILSAAADLLVASGSVTPGAVNTGRAPARSPSVFFAQAAIILVSLAVIKFVGYYRARRRVRRFIPAS